MKILPLLIFIVLITFNVCSFANKNNANTEDEELIIEIIWGSRAKPECRLTAQVGTGIPFAVRSKDGKYSAGGMVGMPDKDGYRVNCTLFTRFSKTSYTMGGPGSSQLMLGIPHEWGSISGVARFYSVTLYRDEKSDKKQLKK